LRISDFGLSKAWRVNVPMNGPERMKKAPQILFPNPKSAIRNPKCP